MTRSLLILRHSDRCDMQGLVAELDRALHARKARRGMPQRRLDNGRWA